MSFYDPFSSNPMGAGFPGSMPGMPSATPFPGMPSAAPFPGMPPPTPYSGMGSSYGGNFGDYNQTTGTIPPTSYSGMNSGVSWDFTLQPTAGMAKYPTRVHIGEPTVVPGTTYGFYPPGYENTYSF